MDGAFCQSCGMPIRQPEEYNYKGIGSYTLEIADGKKEYDFVLNITEKGKSASHNGRSTVTTYYKVEFEGEADGMATMEL